MVWRDGMSEWAAATQVSGLIPVAVVPAAVHHAAASSGDPDELAESLCKIASLRDRGWCFSPLQALSTQDYGCS